MAKNAKEQIAEQKKALEEKIAAEATQETDVKPKPKGSSQVSKASRGVPVNLITSWVDLNLPREDHDVLLRASKFRNVNLAKMLSELFKAQLDTAWDELKADADKYAPSKPTKSFEDMSLEELEAFIAKEQKKMETLQHNIELAKQKVQ